MIPNIGSATGPFPVRGLRFLADSDSNTGTLVFADVGAGGLSKINLQDRTRTTVMTGVKQPNGVTVDDKGFIYMSGMDGNVHRIDPNTGDSSVILPSTGFSIDGIALSPDFKRLYINTEMGFISYIPFDDKGNAGEHVVMAQITGSAGLLDGLAVDECGNIYVVQMSGTIWRVSPDSLYEGDQKVEKAFSMVPETETERYRSSMFAANFGSGVGGWKTESLYIMNMYNNCVYEVDFGVKGASQVHLR